jgi:hypothetical protein
MQGAKYAEVTDHAAIVWIRNGLAIVIRAPETDLRSGAFGHNSLQIREVRLIRSKNMGERSEVLG